LKANAITDFNERDERRTLAHVILHEKSAHFQKRGGFGGVHQPVAVIVGLNGHTLASSHV
jgi:hypothetical protein